MRKDDVLNMFKNKVKFVKPLYKKSRNIRKDKIKILGVKFDSSIDLRGDGVYVNRNVNAESEINLPKNNISIKNRSRGVTLPGACEPSFGDVSRLKFDNLNNTVHTRKLDNFSVIEIPNKSNYNKMLEKESENNLGRSKEFVANCKKIVLHKVSDAWLRVYPAPRKLGESLCSIMIRCVFCQLGLTAILVVWNVMWVFVIHSFEGPQEVNVSLDFEKEQNQLVIDLATELRQITPLSSKWREVIEHRIGDARQLTMLAVGRGAKLKPGLFWDLPGTFLFSIYVMTALGFGAPVPHTVLGRMSALIYAILAVPTHIYLMWNVSSFIVVTIEQCTENLKRKYYNLKNTAIKNSTAGTIPENPNCSENSEMVNKSFFCNKLIVSRFCCTFVIFFSSHCILLSLAMYYLLGVMLFGMLRNRMPLEIIMFPLEFTTTGGLENVKSHVRIIYGFYVEGAMCLIACALANIRRFSSSLVTSMLENYRLFHSVECAECDNHDQCKIIHVT